MLIAEVRKSQGLPVGPDRQPWGRKRHPLIARPKAMLGIMWHAVRHPLTGCIINVDTGEVRPHHE